MMRMPSLAHMLETGSVVPAPLASALAGRTEIEILPVAIQAKVVGKKETTCTFSVSGPIC